MTDDIQAAAHRGFRTPRRDDLVACKRCHQPWCVWVLSKRTGRYYLAFCPSGRGAAYQPHKCDDPILGGLL